MSEIDCRQMGTGGPKPAAIWARVSTAGQSETSLPSQVARCTEELQKAGLHVAHVFQTTWSSLDLYNCHDFQRLRHLVASSQIRAVAVYDRDRLEAKGLQRLIFLAECREHDVQLMICSGPPITEGPEGQIVELALAIGKERQVLRARQGARDGMRDRVILRRKPVTYSPVYGFDWDRQRDTLVPNGDYVHMRLIFNLMLDGATYGRVIKTLQEKGIPSPDGQPIWSKTTISSIVHNPVYAGRYAALKKAIVRDPKSNRAKAIRLPESEWHFVEEVKVENPPVTWQQREQLLQQIKDHQKFSQRNAKHDYLLRGLIDCVTHTGKAGKPRKYHGTPKPGTFFYKCPVGGDPWVSGPELENKVKTAVYDLFSKTRSDLEQMLRRDHSPKKSRAALNAEIQKYERDLASLVQTEARLLDRLLGGKVDQQVHDDLSARYSARRKGIRAKIDAISEEMQGISQEDDAVRSITSLKDRFWTNLRQLSQSQWRELLSALRTQIRIIRPLEDRSVPEWLAGVDFSHHGMTAISSSGVIVDFVLPQQTEEGRIANIVSGDADSN